MYTIVFVHVLGLEIENLLEIMTVKVRNLESLPALRYSVFFNVLHILCNVQVIPTLVTFRISRSMYIL